MKTLERLIAHTIRSQVWPAEDPLQFACREKVGVEDTTLYLIHRTHRPGPGKWHCENYFLSFFSSAFNTIQPLLLQDKLAKMQVDHRVSWITDYLTYRPQFVRLRGCTSDMVTSSTGAPQGTLLFPFSSPCTQQTSRSCVTSRSSWMTQWSSAMDSVWDCEWLSI